MSSPTTAHTDLQYLIDSTNAQGRISLTVEEAQVLVAEMEAARRAIVCAGSGREPGRLEVAAMMGIPNDPARALQFADALIAEHNRTNK
jgi:hypothetical protein